MHPVFNGMNILFVSKDLYQKAIKCISNRNILDEPDESCHTANELRLELLEGMTESMRWSGFSADKFDLNQSVIADDRYDLLKSASIHGLKTVWINPKGELAPELIPVQDWDFQYLDELKEISTSVCIPTRSQCLTWWDEWNLPENVRQHSLTVSHAAYTLAVWMRNKGIAVNPILTHRGGMLHDLDKIKTLNSTGNHGQIAAVFLEQQGFPMVGEIVREHIMSTILDPDADKRSWEVKLVYFCDKLAEGDQLVPFNQRLSALFERYPHYRSTMQQAEQPVWELIERIYSILSIPNHEELLTLLKKSKAKVQ